MLLSFLVFVLIALLTAYYASHGLFSATISLIAAVFASVLAMGLFESLDGPIAGYRPASARGATFLLLFLLALAGCRFGADYLIPKNIRLAKKMVDTVGGAVAGFFAAMIVVGTIAIGLEMMPLPTNLLGASWMPAALGFDRFPEESGMQGDRPGTVASPRNLWFAPDRFTLLVWDGASGRALGGTLDGGFASIHPDLIVESYGYRNTVQYASNPVLPPDLLTVDKAYYSDDANVLARCNAAADARAAVVRIEVKQGGEPPNTSADADTTYFRVSSSEVRMVTDKGRQYYPIGHLVDGTTFEATPLGSGHLVDDYNGSRVIEDWVFQIERDEKPRFIEVKELARKDLVVDNPKTHDPLPPFAAASEYPKRPYRKNASTLNVTVMGDSGPLEGARVFLMNQNTKLSVVEGPLDTASKNIIAERDEIIQGTGRWVANRGKPGIPTEGQLQTYQTWARDDLTLATKDVNSPVRWDHVIPPMLVGNCKPDPDLNVGALPGYFQSTVEPLLRQVATDVLGNAVTGRDGRVELKNVAPGSYTIICSHGTPDAYYLWTINIKLPAKTTVNETLTAARAVFALKK